MLQGRSLLVFMCHRTSYLQLKGIGSWMTIFKPDTSLQARRIAMGLLQENSVLLQEAPKEFAHQQFGCIFIMPRPVLSVDAEGKAPWIFDPPNLRNLL